MVTQAAIANKLGISVVTVSRALAGKEGVGEELREKILATAKEMGYQQKPERAPAPEPLGQVGILMAEHYLRPEHSFFLALHLHATEALKNRGLYGVLELVKPENMDTLPGFVQEGRLEGIMVIGKMPRPYLQMLESTDLPLVYLDFYVPDSRAVSVLADSFLGGWEITRHLIGKGHREIGFVGSIDQDYNAQDRYYGYLKALAEAGLETRDEWLLPNRIHQGFRENYPLPSPAPTAFVCDCDQSAYLFVRSLQQQGYKIPEDISVTGYYDHVFSTLVSPKLTTYQIPMDKLASLGADTLLQLRDKKPVPRRLLVTGDILSRDSVKEISRR